MLICCRYERLLTSVNPLMRWNQGTFMVPSGTRLDDLLLTSWPGSQSHMRSIFLILSSTLSLVWVHLFTLGGQRLVYLSSLCAQKDTQPKPLVKCCGMSAYKQIIVCGVKLPKALQLLCPFLPAKTSILHGGGRGVAVNPFFPQTCAQRWYHVKHLHGSVWPLLGCY